MKGKIILSSKELHRVRVLQHVLDGRINLKEAAVLLQISYRQVRRLKKRYQEDWAAGLIHGNRGRSVSHAVDPGLAEQVLKLHEQKYRLFNDTHFTEMLAEREGINLSRETVRRILRGAGKKPKRRRRPKKYHGRRPRKDQVGMMMQWDGSPHRWFGPDLPPCCLMSAIDDADGRILAARFVPSETSVAYLQLLNQVLTRHGAPLAVYQDRHTALMRSDGHWSLEEQLHGRQFPTHVGRALEEFSIQAIPAYSPQAKGRVERLFGILQDRLIAELALEGITEIKEANLWLERVFVPSYNRRFCKKAAKAGSVFRKTTKQERYLKIGFAYEATVANDNCVRLGGLSIDIPPSKGRPSWAKAKVLVRQHLDGSWTVWCRGKKIATHPPTELREPVRSRNRRRKGDPRGAISMLQVDIDSKPAPPP